MLKACSPVLRRKSGQIRKLIRETQDRFGLKLRAVAVMPDHVHLIMKVDRREQFQNALRFLAGAIALKVAGTRLWRARAWSRPLRTRRELDVAQVYVARNSIKAGIFSLGDAYAIVDGVLQL